MLDASGVNLEFGVGFLTLSGAILVLELIVFWARRVFGGA